MRREIRAADLHTGDIVIRTVWPIYFIAETSVEVTDIARHRNPGFLVISYRDGKFEPNGDDLLLIERTDDRDLLWRLLAPKRQQTSTGQP